MEHVPIIPCKNYTSKVTITSNGEVMFRLRFERKPRGYKTHIRYGPTFTGVGRTYRIAQARAWRQCLDTLQPVTCPGCNKPFKDHWAFWQHQQFMPAGIGYYSAEAGDYECPDTAYIDF